MAFSLSESTSKATDNRIAVTDQGQVLRGQGSQNSPFSNAKVNTGISKSKINTGIANSKVNTGQQVKIGKVGKGAVVTLGDTTGAGATAAATAVSDLSKKFADTVEATGKQDLTNKILDTLKGVGENATLQTALAKVNPTVVNVGQPSPLSSAGLNAVIDDAAKNATDQATTTGNNWLKYAAIGLALAAAFFFFKKLR
jgi:hypothetical protein